MQSSLILASGSAYRRTQLLQIGLDPISIAPAIDETPMAGEAASALARRLAISKAEAIARLHPTALILAGDQSAECAGRLLGKPGTEAAAIEQLQWMAGKESVFYSAFCLLHGQQKIVEVVPTTIKMRALSTAEIQTYIAKEQPLDCAGSFKVEGLGITLFDWIRSDDPSALIGLPLIAVARALRALAEKGALAEKNA